MTRCAVCNSENLDLAIRCGSCGSLLQQRAKTIDLFDTLFNVWRYPDFTFRRVILAEHRNYTIPLAFLEAIGLSFFFLFIVKAGDIFSIDLGRLLTTGVGLAVVVFLPFLYLFVLAGYFLAGVSRTGASRGGFTAGMIYAMHPIALSAIIILPSEIAVFGSYVFSNNPSPVTINSVPFFLLAFLDIFLGLAAALSIARLTKLLFGTMKKAIIFAGNFFILWVVAVEIAKRLLVK